MFFSSINFKNRSHSIQSKTDINQNKLVNTLVILHRQIDKESINNEENNNKEKTNFIENFADTKRKEYLLKQKEKEALELEKKIVKKKINTMFNDRFPIENKKNRPLSHRLVDILIPEEHNKKLIETFKVKLDSQKKVKKRRKSLIYNLGFKLELAEENLKKKKNESNKMLIEVGYLDSKFCESNNDINRKKIPNQAMRIDLKKVNNSLVSCINNNEEAMISNDMDIKNNKDTIYNKNTYRKYYNNKYLENNDLNDEIDYNTFVYSNNIDSYLTINRNKSDRFQNNSNKNTKSLSLIQHKKSSNNNTNNNIKSTIKSKDKNIFNKYSDKTNNKYNHDLSFIRTNPFRTNAHFNKINNTKGFPSAVRASKTSKSISSHNNATKYENATNDKFRNKNVNNSKSNLTNTFLFPYEKNDINDINGIIDNSLIKLNQLKHINFKSQNNNNVIGNKEIKSSNNININNTSKSFYNKKNNNNINKELNNKLLSSTISNFNTKFTNIINSNNVNSDIKTAKDPIIIDNCKKKIYKNVKSDIFDFSYNSQEQSRSSSNSTKNNEKNDTNKLNITKKAKFKDANQYIINQLNSPKANDLYLNPIENKNTNLIHKNLNKKNTHASLTSSNNQKRTEESIGNIENIKPIKKGNKKEEILSPSSIEDYEVNELNIRVDNLSKNFNKYKKKVKKNKVNEENPRNKNNKDNDGNGNMLVKSDLILEINRNIDNTKISNINNIEDINQNNCNTRNILGPIDLNNKDLNHNTNISKTSKLSKLNHTNSELNKIKNDDTKKEINEKEKTAEFVFNIDSIERDQFKIEQEKIIIKERKKEAYRLRNKRRNHFNCSINASNSLPYKGEFIRKKIEVINIKKQYPKYIDSILNSKYSVFDRLAVDITLSKKNKICNINKINN